jgi:PKD repeat protein
VSNPFHTYSAIGKYKVKLMVQNKCGQENSRIDSIIISNKANFPQQLQIYTNNGSTELSGCPGDVFNLYTDYNATNMLWKFGDGDSSTNRKPSHVYAANGKYIISLKLINGCGNDTTIYNQAVIGNHKSFGPNASIEVQPKDACPGDAVSFNFKESAISYLWNFGDGVTSDKSNPSHSFLSTGIKSVSLNVTNSCGSDSIFTTQVNLADTIKPVLSRSGDKGGNWGSLTDAACPGDSIMFYSFDGTVCIFDFGDGTVSNQTSKLMVDQGEVKIIKHAYSVIGTYKVKLTIFNYCGNSTTDSMNITVGGAQPITGELGIISNEPYYTCHKVQFMGTMGTNFIWYLPDGDSIVSDLNILDYSFSKPGSYIMKLKVTNGCGNSAIFTRDINIVALPKPLVIQQLDSMIVKTDATYYQWYRNGDSIPGANHSIYRFNKSGQYSVKISDKQGCFSTSDDYAICFVYAGEDVSVCPGGIVQLSASGTDNFSWTPANGLSNTSIANPTAQPSSNTQYVVTGTSVGCTAKDSVMVTLVAVLNAIAGNDVTICNGDSLILQGSGGGDYSWSPSESLQYPNTAFPLAKPITNTTYTLAVSSGSCTDTDEVIVTVQPKPTLSVVADENICVGSSAQLQASVTNASGIEWKGIGSFTPDKYQNNVNYTPSNGEKLSGLATIYVNTMGTGFCATLNKTVSINLVIVGIPVITLKNDTLIVPAGYSGYQWYKDGNIINGAIERSYKPTANDTYTVVAFGTFSCFSTSEPYNYIATKLNNDLSAGYTMYPNPVQDILNVKTGDQKAILTIYSIDGRVLSTISLTGNDNKVSVSNLRPGAYYLRIQSSGNSFVVKMIKE